MTFTKTLAAAAASTFIAGSAMAGGLAPVVDDITIVEPTPTGSLPGWVIPALIVAALIGVASSASDDGDDDTAGGGGVGGGTNDR